MYNKFQETVQFKDGRYEIALPWKDSHRILPNSYQLSLNRLDRLLRCLQQDKDILREYDPVIKTQIQQEIVEIVEHPKQTAAERVHLMIAMTEKDCDVLRFLWVDDVSN